MIILSSVPCGVDLPFSELLAGHGVFQRYQGHQIERSNAAFSSEAGASELVVIPGGHLASLEGIEGWIETPLPVLSFGISIDETLTESHPVALKKLVERRGPLRCSNVASRRRVEEACGEGTAVLFPSAAALIESTPVFGRRGNHVLVVPPPVHDPLFEMAADWYSTWQRTTDSVSLLPEAQVTGSFAYPGLSTILSPKFAAPLVKALVSARLVVSFRPEAALVALQNGGAAVGVATDTESEETFSELGIPVFRLADKSLVSDLSNWIGTVGNGEFRRAKEASVFWSHSAQALGKEMTPTVSPSKACEITVCCIADETYLPFLVGLWENLWEVCRGPLSIHWLALTRDAPSPVPPTQGQGSITRYELDEIWGEERAKMIRSRPIADQAYASKSKLLQTVLTKTAGPVFYFDLDIYFFASPWPLIGALGDGAVLLFPQWNERLYISKFFGVYNAGMMLVSPGAERFLSWWSELCLGHYESDIQKGYFVDQGLLDLAPAYFEEVRSYRAGDENVACWNLKTLGVTLSGALDGGSGRKVRSFHAAREDVQGFFEVKHTWDQVCAKTALTLGENEPLILNTLLQQRRYLPQARRLFFMVRVFQTVFGTRRGLKWTGWHPFFSHGWGRGLAELGLWIFSGYRTLRTFLRRHRFSEDESLVKIQCRLPRPLH